MLAGPRYTMELEKQAGVFPILQVGGFPSLQLESWEARPLSGATCSRRWMGGEAGPPLSAVAVGLAGVTLFNASHLVYFHLFIGHHLFLTSCSSSQGWGRWLDTKTALGPAASCLLLPALSPLLPAQLPLENALSPFPVPFSATCLRRGCS